MAGDMVASAEHINEVNLRRYHKVRNEWLIANGPCVHCGSWCDLQIDHIDPKTKDQSLSRTNIWNISKKRRDEELAKCQVLCRSCHQAKTGRELHKTVCVNGHQMTEDNIYLIPNKGNARACIQCRENYNQKRRDARRKTRV